jgi:hypothetical protein
MTMMKPFARGKSAETD